MDNNDYYELLGVTKSSRPEEIKAAYRDLVKRYHPDVNPAGNAAVMFRLIQEAYEVIGDPQKRAAYDAPPTHAQQQEPTQQQPSKQHKKSSQKPFKQRKRILLTNDLSFDELRQSKFVFLESVFIAVLLFVVLHLYLENPLAANIAISCGVGLTIFFGFHIRVAIWLVSIGCTLFWGWFAADIAYSVSGRDTKTTLIWGIGTLLLTAAFHIKEASEL